MTDLLFPLSPPALPIVGDSRRYPVGRIFCVGRNYAAHTREMGGHESRDPPIFFMKAADAVTQAESVPFPKDTDDLHHEVELVVAIGEGGAIFGYAVGCDLTKRDRQNELKDAGAPWERCKAFEKSAPITAITPAAQAGNVNAARISLTVNGETRQDSNTSDLIWPVKDIVTKLNDIWDLRAGDIIYTGTPQGVGPLKRGDRVECKIDGLPTLAFSLN